MCTARALTVSRRPCSKVLEKAGGAGYLFWGLSWERVTRGEETPVLRARGDGSWSGVGLRRYISISAKTSSPGFGKEEEEVEEKEERRIMAREPAGKRGGWIGGVVRGCS